MSQRLSSASFSFKPPWLDLPKVVTIIIGKSCCNYLMGNFQYLVNYKNYTTVIMSKLDTSLYQIRISYQLCILRKFQTEM